MTTALTLPAPNSTTGSLRRLAGELGAREPRLTAFGAVLLALLLPMAVAWAIDDRTVQDANVWIKPMKFALSIAVFAFTTAWFAGHLPAAQRAGRAMNRIVRLLVWTGTFELGYIAFQAALGQASHYNTGDPFHAAMYALMGIAALGLTATQPMLAWQLYRHPDPARAAVYRETVIVGLVLTFVFGAGIGGLLGNLEPPATGARLPLLSWALEGGDLRPAHFVGIHAAQALPLAGFVIAALRVRRARALAWACILAYGALFAGLVAWGLAGRL
jgi:hypothetical protein